MLLQEDESDAVTVRKEMTWIRQLEKATFSFLDMGRRSGNKLMEHMFAKASLLSWVLHTEQQGHLHSVC